MLVRKNFNPMFGPYRKLFSMLEDRVVEWCNKAKSGMKEENQSHYREVPRWDIFMEQELIFGLDLGRFG